MSAAARGTKKHGLNCGNPLAVKGTAVAQIPSFMSCLIRILPRNLSKFSLILMISSRTSWRVESMLRWQGGDLGVARCVSVV